MPAILKQASNTEYQYNYCYLQKAKVFIGMSLDAASAHGKIERTP
jgi:hypothetical protein